jgi:hypothetical protein
VALALGRPASAQSIVQLDGAANAGYTETSGQTGSSQAFTEVRPALTLHFLSPRVALRAGYAFAGHVTLDQQRLLSYSNELALSLGAELSNRSAMIVSAAVDQGKTDYLFSHRAADAGQPAFRSADNPDLVTAMLTESYALEASPQLRFGQALAGSLVAPQSALGNFNASVTGSLSLDREIRNEWGPGARNAVGAELRSSAAVLRSTEPTTLNVPYWNIRNSLLARWNHDFTLNWNGIAMAGVEQVLTLFDSYPLAILPTGTLALRYATRNGGGGITASYGATADLQTGIMSLSESVVLRGFVAFDSTYPRQLAASAGILRAEPLGQSAAKAAAGLGDAAQGDVGLLWGLSDEVLATARYSVAYQFRQPGGLQPLLTHVVLVGITMHYSNTRHPPAVPALGGRVDGSDRVGFPDKPAGKP